MHELLRNIASKHQLSKFYLISKERERATENIWLSVSISQPALDSAKI